MAATPAELFALFDRLDIEHSTVEHPPFFTVEEGRPWHDKIPGLHCKNLFIKDRKGGIWLVVMPADKQADLGRLEKALSAPRFSFARPDVLQEVLALTPGSVTPFGLINDVATARYRGARRGHAGQRVGQFPSVAQRCIHHASLGRPGAVRSLARL